MQIHSGCCDVFVPGRIPKLFDCYTDVLEQIQLSRIVTSDLCVCFCGWVRVTLGVFLGGMSCYGRFL